MNQLFDKSVEINFYTVQGGPVVDKIVIPETGLKPNITLSATFHPSDVVGSVEIRIVNYYPSTPLSEYQWMTVTAGYKHGKDTATISGQVKVAYNESPSPDGVTFISMLIGNVDDLLNKDVDMSFPGGFGITIDSVLSNVATSLGANWTMQNSSNTAGKTLDNAGFSFQGKAIDCLNKIKDRWKLAFLIEGTTLVFYTPNKGRTSEPAIEINYLSSPPIANASGITFTAPWNPKLRPGMVVQINPLYFRQTFGGRQIQYQKDGLMICQTVSVQFNTVTNQNTMTVLVLNTYEVPQASGS